MEIGNLLLSLKNKLEEERNLLLKLDSPDQLVKVIEEKKHILSKLSNYDRESFEGFEELLKEIDLLSKKNLSLAMNNMSMIDEIFSAIFEENIEKYDNYGHVSKEGKSGIFDKKI